MEPLFPDEQELNGAIQAGYLINGFINRSLTLEEEAKLDEWIMATDANMALFERLTSQESQARFMACYDNSQMEQRLLQSKQRLGVGSEKRSTSKTGLLLAACAIVLLGVAAIAWYMSTLYAGSGSVANMPIASPVSPSAMTLTLGDGKKLVLDGQRDTSLMQGLTMSGGVLRDNRNSGAVVRQIETARQGIAQIVLPDGSHVWLNGSTSLQYSDDFNQLERRVTLKGQAFFSVAKDPTRPFIVTANGVEVQALGTEFDVNGYDRIQASLLEGSIRVSNAFRNEVLQPLQSLTIADDQWNKATILHPEALTDWKRSEFNWRDAPLATVLITLQRWYDVEFTLEKPIDIHLNGTISRDVPLSNVLKLLENTGQLHFTTLGKVIKVHPGG